MSHFAHYVRREIVEYGSDSGGEPLSPPQQWFAEEQELGDAFDVPTQHVTRSSNGPVLDIKVGDTLWIFSQLRAPWLRFPPALDFKITVSEIADQRATRSKNDPAFRFSADRDRSKWFPLFNARAYLERIKTIDSRGHSRPLLGAGQSIGQALQGIRKIADATPILELEDLLGSIEFDFISYRLKDGTRAASHASSFVLNNGGAVFWDRWSLPRRVAERRERVSTPLLDRFLISRIRASRNVWAIESPTYAQQGSYSLTEKEEAEEHGKLNWWKPVL